MPQGLTRIACGRGIAIGQIVFNHERSQSVDKKGVEGGACADYQTLIHKSGAPSQRPNANRKPASWAVNFLKFVFKNVFEAQA
jgi:hypothetical protein